jgi:hypothetical protein
MNKGLHQNCMPHTQLRVSTQQRRRQRETLCTCTLPTLLRVCCWGGGGSSGCSGRSDSPPTQRAAHTHTGAKCRRTFGLLCGPEPMQIGVSSHPVFVRSDQMSGNTSLLCRYLTFLLVAISGSKSWNQYENLIVYERK